LDLNKKTEKKKVGILTYYFLYIHSPHPPTHSQRSDLNCKTCATTKLTVCGNVWTVRGGGGGGGGISTRPVVTFSFIGTVIG
jgi:hypothetical protein